MQENQQIINIFKLNTCSKSIPASSGGAFLMEHKDTKAQRNITNVGIRINFGQNFENFGQNFKNSGQNYYHRVPA